MESRLLNNLAANGCSVERALKDTFLGNEGFYAKIFGKLAANDALSRLEKALVAQDVKAVFEAAHELKGMYGNLGLTPLADRVCAIVEIARADSLEGVAGLLPDLKALHAKIVALGE